jgi:hypothetical protein
MHLLKKSYQQHNNDQTDTLDKLPVGYQWVNKDNIDELMQNPTFKQVYDKIMQRQQAAAANPGTGDAGTVDDGNIDPGMVRTPRDVGDPGIIRQRRRPGVLRASNDDGQGGQDGQTPQVNGGNGPVTA